MINYNSLFRIKVEGRELGGREVEANYLSTPEKPLMEWGLLERKRFKRGLSDQSGVMILAGAQSFALSSPTDSCGDER